MAEIILSHNNSVVEKEHVTIKANGWVKAYDEVERDVGEDAEYEGLVNYPPKSIKGIRGDVNYTSPHGRI